MRNALLVAASLLAVAAIPAFGGDKAAEQIVAMERAALDLSDAGDVKGFLDISSPDVVYQDPALTKPIVGLEALTAYYAKFPNNGEPSQGEMKNTQVQVYGDTAILSFHYTVRRHDTVLREWNCTEVYRKGGDAWRIVNTHWSLTLPMPQTME